MATSTIRSPRAQPVETPARETDASWRPIYRLAGIAALLSISCVVAAIVVYLLNPIPTTIAGWFALYQRNPVIGLFSGDLMMLISFVAMGMIYVGLYGALRRVHEPLTLLATVSALASVIIYTAINPAFSMLALSGQYAQATSDAQRAQLLGAGQAVIANWQGSGFDVSYLLAAIAGLLFGFLMLRRGSVFGRWTAYSAIAMGALSLVPAAAGFVGVVFSLLALLPTLVWLALIAWRFLTLETVRRAG